MKMTLLVKYIGLDLWLLIMLTFAVAYFGASIFSLFIELGLDYTLSLFFLGFFALIIFLILLIIKNKM